MREEEILVPRPGGIIRATLTRGGSESLVVYLPCFGGDFRMALPHMAAHQFPEKYGVSFIRVDLVTLLDGGRNLSDQRLRLQDHVHDLQAVVTYAREQCGLGLDTVHGIAHSLSAYPLVMAAASQSMKLDSIALWDGSDPVNPGLEVAFRLEKATNEHYHYFRGGMGFVIADSYLRDIGEFRLSDYTSQWHTPTLVVAAGEGILLEAAEVYERTLRPAKRVVIDGANHHFTADSRWTEQLFSVTGEWLRGGFREV